MELACLLAEAALLKDTTRTPSIKAEAGASAGVVNRALVGPMRMLVPVGYTTGDRFTPGPALPQNAYPTLDPLRILAAAPAASETSLFAVIAAMCAMNRVAIANGEALNKKTLEGVGWRSNFHLPLNNEGLNEHSLRRPSCACARVLPVIIGAPRTPLEPVIRVAVQEDLEEPTEARLVEGEAKITRPEVTTIWRSAGTSESPRSKSRPA